jgi:hypothetical protein
MQPRLHMRQLIELDVAIPSPVYVKRQALSSLIQLRNRRCLAAARYLGIQRPHHGVTPWYRAHGCPGGDYQSANLLGELAPPARGLVR